MSNPFEERIFKKNQGFPWQSIDDDTIIIDPKNQISHELNEVGTFVWSLIDGHRTCRQIVTKICDTYEVNRQTAMVDVEELMNDLRVKALISEV